MARKAKITVYLVEESAKEPKKKLEKEIFQALSKRAIVPWVRQVEKVEVTDE